jgi:hypothetical protein
MLDAGESLPPGSVCLSPANVVGLWRDNLRPVLLYVRTTPHCFVLVCPTNRRVDATEGGKNAILALADGDLRRVLNLLQSTAMAYPQVQHRFVFVLSSLRRESSRVDAICCQVHTSAPPRCTVQSFSHCFPQYAIVRR